MAGNDDAVFVKQDWHQKAEGGDAVGDLADLLLRVGARVTRVGFDRVNCDPLYSDHEVFPFLTISRSSTRFDQRWLRTSLVRKFGLARLTQIASRLCVRLCYSSDCQPDCAARGSRHRRGDSR